MFNETIAGSAAGITGTILGYPFDSIKSRMQTSRGVEYSTLSSSARTIMANEGFQGFYRGVASPLCALTVLNMLNFSTYARFRSRLIGDFDTTKATINPMFFVAGACSGPVASVISTPFELLKLQLQVDKRHGNTLRCMRSILSEYGPRHLYRGVAVNTQREIIFLGTYFFCYEHTKDACTRYMSVAYGVPLAGGVAGAVGWFISFPLDSIKSVIQGAPLNSTAPRARVVAKDLVKTKGLFGLYRGLAPSITRAFVVSSTRFSAYETVLYMLSGDESAAV